MKTLKLFSALLLTFALLFSALPVDASRVVINGIPYEQFSRLILPRSTTLPTTCQNAEIFIDTDATSGAQIYVCESGSWVQQSPSGGGSLSVDTTNFDGILSATENTVQKAFDAIDDFTNVKTDLNAPNGKLTAGTQGAATNGNLWLYGSTAVSGAGGQLVLYNAATYYDTEPGFIIQPVDGNLEIGPSGDTNALTWIQATGKWQIDGNVGGVELLHAGSLKFATTATGISVTDGTETTDIYYSGTTLIVLNKGTSGSVQLQGYNSGDVAKAVFDGNPDGGATLYYQGSARFQIQTDGTRVVDGVEALDIKLSAGDVKFKSQTDSSTITIAADVPTNSEKTVAKFDPAGAAELYYAGTAMLKTVDGGISFGSSGSQVTMIESGDNVSITNTAADGALTLYVTKSGPTTQAGITISPGSSVALAYDGVNKFSTDTDGVAMVDAGKTVYDAAPASDETGTGDQISETVDQNTYGIAGLLVLSSDGNWDDADKDAMTTCGMLALAIESGTGTKKLIQRGYMRDDTWNWTPGSQLFVGDSGAIVDDVSGYTTGDCVQVVGYAKTADIIYFNPSVDSLEL